MTNQARDKVFIITAGEYSNYHIVGAYSSLDLAWQVVGDRQDYDVEEFELNPGMDKLNQGLFPFSVSMNYDGSVREIFIYAELVNWTDHAEQDISIFPSYQFTAEELAITNRQRWFRTYCWARDKDHATKIANERRAMLIAEGKLRP